MPFPWTYYSTFQTGNTDEWDSESDTGARLDIAHFSAFAGLPYSSAVPYRGAYSCRIVLGDTNDHTLTDTEVNIASASESWLRFYLNVVELITTAQDIFPILELQDYNSVVRFGIYLRSDYTGGATQFYQIGVGGNQGGAAYLTPQLATNRWHCLELSAKPGNTTGNVAQSNGAATLFVNGTLTVSTSAIVANPADGTRADVDTAVLGTQDTVATTTGVILLNDFVFDDARVFPLRDRFTVTPLLEATHFAFLGPGRVDNVKLISGNATNNRLAIYDTDRATGSLGGMPIRTYVGNTAANEVVDAADVPIEIVKGCYVVLEGTNPRALVKIGRAAHHSQAGVKRLAAGRRDWPGQTGETT